MDKETAARVGVYRFGPVQAVFDKSSFFRLDMEQMPVDSREKPIVVPCEQTLILLDGELSCQVEGQSLHLSAGALERGELAFLAIPPGVQYVCRNSGGRPARYIRLSFPKEGN